MKGIEWCTDVQVVPVCPSGFAKLEYHVVPCAMVAPVQADVLSALDFDPVVHERERVAQPLTERIGKR